MLQSLRSFTTLGLVSLSLLAGSALGQAGSPGRDAAQTNSKDTVEASAKKPEGMKPKTSPANTRRVEDGANPPTSDTVRGTKKIDCPPAGTGGVPMPDCKEGPVDPTGAVTTPGVNP